MSVAVLIPWRDLRCPHRSRALEYVTTRLQAEHPVWPVAIGHHEEGAWCKALAIADALAQTQAEVLILHDADCWTDGLLDAVARVCPKAYRRLPSERCSVQKRRAGSTLAPSPTAHDEAYTWAIPHKGVQRLTEASTGRCLAGESWERLPLAQAAYGGTEGGGIVVVRREVYEACPLDPRFVGWGSEDESWGWALTTLHGRAWRGKAALVHLWHPPQSRMSRAIGSEESGVLRKRYTRALRNPSAMAALIEEAHDAHRALESADDDRSALAG